VGKAEPPGIGAAVADGKIRDPAVGAGVSVAVADT